jgi:hypothetical protein
MFVLNVVMSAAFVVTSLNDNWTTATKNTWVTWIDEFFYSALMLTSYVFYCVGVYRISRFIKDAVLKRELDIRILRLHILFTAIFFAGNFFTFLSTIEFFRNDSSRELLVALTVNNFTNAIGQILLFKILNHLNKDQLIVQNVKPIVPKTTSALNTETFDLDFSVDSASDPMFENTKTEFSIRTLRQTNVKIGEEEVESTHTFSVDGPTDTGSILF